MIIDGFGQVATMAAAVVLLFAALAGAVAVGVRYERFTAQRRFAGLREFARSHGWRYSVDGSGADPDRSGGVGGSDAGPAWEWRFAGDTMIGYRPGRLTSDRLMDGLEGLSDVLGRIPAEAWRHSGPAAA